MRALAVAAGLCVTTMVAACDESFDPIAPSDVAFSVWGLVDAGADTQLIRVTPPRRVKLTSRDPLAVTVTLEELVTGRIIALEDSVFAFGFFYDWGLGAESRYFHNFWTTERIEPGASYRFSARREGKEPAEAVVAIPNDFEVELAIDQARWAPQSPWDPVVIYDSLRISGLKHLPFLSAVTHFSDKCGSTVSRIRYDHRVSEDGTYTIAITMPGFGSRDGCRGPMYPVVENRELWIMGSEAAWPTGGYDPVALGESALTSNVTNAVGFLGGVFSKDVPYESCAFQSDGAPIPQYCLLRFHGETATIYGTVTQMGCGGGPVPWDTVRLTELGPDPARIITVVSSRAGEFVIGALEPGIPHLLWARAPSFFTDSVFELRDGRWHYRFEEFNTRHTDTVTFSPGQRMRYDIQLGMNGCAPPPPAG